MPVAERTRAVPGRNAASYTDSGPEHQLCETIYFVVSPKIPVVDEPILMYLISEVPDIEDLDSARLHVTMDWDTNPNEAPMTLEWPLSETPWLRIRKRTGPWTPGNVLSPGFNELLADYQFIGIFIDTGNYTFKLRVKLPDPDGKLLFGFEQSFYLEGTSW